MYNANPVILTDRPFPAVNATNSAGRKPASKSGDFVNPQLAPGFRNGKVATIQSDRPMLALSASTRSTSASVSAGSSVVGKGKGKAVIEIDDDDDQQENRSSTSSASTSRRPGDRDDPIDQFPEERASTSRLVPNSAQKAVPPGMVKERRRSYETGQQAEPSSSSRKPQQVEDDESEDELTIQQEHVKVKKAPGNRQLQQSMKSRGDVESTRTAGSRSKAASTRDKGKRRAPNAMDDLPLMFIQTEYRKITAPRLKLIVHGGGDSTRFTVEVSENKDPLAFNLHDINGIRLCKRGDGDLPPRTTIILIFSPESAMRRQLVPSSEPGRSRTRYDAIVFVPHLTVLQSWKLRGLLRIRSQAERRRVGL